MLILAGCLLYSVFNAMLFAFVYYRRKQMERMEATFTGTGPDPPQQLMQQLRSLSIDKSLTHNAWLHEVAMRQICTSKELVGLKQLKEAGPRAFASKNTRHLALAGAQHHSPIRERDIFLRIRNLYGPFVDVQIVNRVFHENRKFDTPVLVYRYDEVTKPQVEAGQGQEKRKSDISKKLGK